MTAIHSFEHVVRSYEVDPDLVARPSVYLHWFQEAAIEAGAARGYPLARYTSIQRAWVFTHHRLRWLAQARYLDRLVLRCWISAVPQHRCGAVRELTVARKETGEVIFHGQAELMYLDRTSLRPTPLTQALIEDFSPDGVSPIREHPLERAPLPASGADAFEARRVARFEDLDLSNHVNNASYLRWAIDELFGVLMGKSNAGAPAPVLSQAEISYCSPVLHGDEIAVKGLLRGQPAGRRFWSITMDKGDRRVANVMLGLRAAGEVSG
jgi:acyl-CoA thioesterase FadM